MKSLERNKSPNPPMSSPELTSSVDSISTDLPPSYTGMNDARRDSTAMANVYFNEAIVSFTGKLAASYLSRQNNRSNHSLLSPFGSGILQLPPDLEVAKKSLMSTMSALYAMALIVLCISFTATEIITEKVPLDYFESFGFYTYLYAGSVSFMLYLFCYVLRVKYSGKNGGQEDDFDVDDFIRRMTQATGLSVQEIQSQPDERRIRDGRRFSIRPPINSQISDDGGNHEMWIKLMTSENDKSHGSLFLRIGAIAFGLGTLIYTGLEFLTFFEIPNTCKGWSILLGINPVLYMIFVFMQMYYIFNHSRLNVNKNKLFAKFGMMHLVATNVCIVIRTLVKESVKEIFHGEEPHQNSTKIDEACKHFEIIGDAIEHSSVYLFPFIIEYSIIGSEVLYSMWKHIGKNPEYVMVGDSEDSHKGKQNREPMDWSSSSFGLFMGLLSLVTLIITLILYFALIDQEEFRLVSILVNNVSDTGVNLLMIFAMVVGFFQLKHLKIEHLEGDLDVVMIITAFGIFVYSSFTIIAGCLNDNSYEPGQLVVVNGIVELLEVNIQLMFIADLKHKRIDESKPELKPGRQAVTFLMICNLGLWITYNFEIQKVNATPDQVEFYGFLAWVIVQRITLPLCVFFRFHSTVVLAELWKNCYRIKKKE